MRRSAGEGGGEGAPMLRLERVTHRFGETTAVADLSLELAPGELLTLLGPSGCGKTTTLRMIAGFETPDAGRILLDGKEITHLPPQRRGFGMVFQNYALFPHLDVAGNVAFGLEGRGLPRAEVRRRVEEALALVDLAGYGTRKVQQLSGGQQQRVALARALAPEPRILLLDEPLSNLDAALRERTRSELRSLLRRLGITAIFVTHDQEEAFALADRVAIMERGHLQQVGTPEELYRRPANPFVATFLGRANFLDAQVLGREGEWLICELPGGLRWQVPSNGTTAVTTGASEVLPHPAPASDSGPTTASHPATTTGASKGSSSSHHPMPGDQILIMVRPEDLSLADAGESAGAGADSAESTLPATVVERRFAGPTTNYLVRCGDNELLVLGRPGDATPGQSVRLRLAPDATPVLFPAAPTRPEQVPELVASGGVRRSTPPPTSP